jgi:hypothetical protein
MNGSVVDQLNGDCVDPNDWKGCAVERHSDLTAVEFAVESNDEELNDVKTDWKRLVANDGCSVY